MYVINITDDYDIITSSNFTGYDISSAKCTNNENNFDITIPALLLLPCGLKILWSSSIMVYTLIKPFFKNE